MKIEIKTLNNKSRKGEYIYIKQKGIRGKYYKYNPKIELEYYIERYTDKNLRNLGMKQYKEKTPTEQAKKIVKELRKKPRIQTQINKGESKITRQLKEINNISIIKEYEKLFRPLVINPENLKTIIQNRQKLKSGMTHTITINGIIGDNGEYGVLGILKYFNTSLEELLNKLDGLKENMNISSKTIEQFKANKVMNTKKGIVRNIKVETRYNK